MIVPFSRSVWILVGHRFGVALLLVTFAALVFASHFVSIDPSCSSAMSHARPRSHIGKAASRSQQTRPAETQYYNHLYSVLNLHLHLTFLSDQSIHVPRVVPK